MYWEQYVQSSFKDNRKNLRKEAIYKKPEKTGDNPEKKNRKE